MVKTKFELEDERATKRVLFFFWETKYAFEVKISLFRNLVLALSENQNPQCYLCPLLWWALHWNTTFGNTLKGILQNPQQH